jgi:predicted SAM-dependent methyltransferase
MTSSTKPTSAAFCPGSPPELDAGGFRPSKRLHIGSGSVHLDGWINLDNQHYDGVDAVIDVREGLPFDEVDFIFAEHFIEHLEYADGLQFLKECRRVLHPRGVLRLSTPNLDWVWVTQYHFGQWQEPQEEVRDCFWINKAFRGWGHRFLYNFETLTQTLREAGFARVEQASYSQSRYPELRNLERHELYVDAPGISHLVVVEATGVSAKGSEMLRDPLEDYSAVINLK